MFPADTHKDCPGEDTAIVESASGSNADVVLQAQLRQRRSHLTAIATAAAILAAGNFLTFLSLPWYQETIIGQADPAIWITLGLLVPAALLCVSLYRDYWVRRESRGGIIETLGPYVLTEKLGSGGMGDVFLAEHQLMKRHCAVKLIHSENAGNKAMRRSFEREAKATAQLTHWNTIEIYDYGTSADGRFYYVMEYLKGLNLWHYVEEYGPMPPGRVIYILKQLCDALHEAECSGLVHRDIKPSNIFLTERGCFHDVVKLLDFGLVQGITKSAKTCRDVSTRLHGSPSFMCPEQARGLTPDSRGDLYSLGAVAYYLLTGRPPFTDENPVMLVVAHATCDVPTFDEIGVFVPADLSRVILRCLARNVDERYAGARILRHELEKCDCNNDWSRQHAEEWWLLNEPTTRPDQRPCHTAAPTLQFDRDTAMDVHRRSNIDYDEPTVIMDYPAGLATSDAEFA